MIKVIFKFDKEKDLWDNGVAINFESKLEKSRKFNNLFKLDKVEKR